MQRGYVVRVRYPRRESVGMPAKKSTEQYEADAIWVGECLVYPVTAVARKLYERRHGPIGSSKVFVCHTCDNPRCINDDHHFLGSQKDNVEDAKRKGRLKYTPERLAKMKIILNSAEVVRKQRLAGKRRFKNPEVRAEQAAAQHKRYKDPAERAKLQRLPVTVMKTLLNVKEPVD